MAESTSSLCVIPGQGLRKKVDTLALISPNEEVDDIATKDLKFLLVDYYLADLHQRGQTSSYTASSSSLNKRAAG